MAMKSEKSLKRSIKNFSSAVAIPSLNSVTELTKSLKFKANGLSSAMDTAGGGYLKHGGFHRLYGGHDISSAAYWKKYGFRYGKELSKDFITPNGLPIPKLQVAVKKGMIKTSVAQKYGTWTIGKASAALVGIADTGFVIKKFIKNRDELSEHWISNTAKGVVKAVVGVSSGNLPLAAAGLIDLSLVAVAKIEDAVELDLSFEFLPIN
jgi:hypothetical protein